MDFKSWLFGLNMVSLETSYTKLYFITLSFVALGLILICTVASLKSVSQKIKIRIAKILSIILLLSNVIFIIVCVARGETSLRYYWPLFPCALNAYLVPIACLTNSKILKKMFYVVALIGAVLTFAFPQKIWSYEFMCYDTLNTTIKHALLIYITMSEFVGNSFRPKLFDVFLSIDGWVIHFVNVVFVKTIFNISGDFLYFQTNIIPTTFLPKPFIVISFVFTLTFLIHFVFYLLDKFKRRKV